MALIQELSPHIADLIAAGEVVERPASVAKELVENAIDAGATRIQVEIQAGGVPYLRITDNGIGMSPEDALMSFRRHATSKLRTQEDLVAISTLGFRGEALAAIAAVARIDLFTKQKGTIAGQHLRVEGGVVHQNEEAGCPEGTTFIIRDLFFNTPARMKFLKKDFTEAGYVIGVVEHAALSHPEIAFVMVRDSKQIFATAGDGKLLTPVHGVFGRETISNMVAIEPAEHEGVTVSGYITKPHFCRPNRSMQHFFVNQRYIKSKTLQAALEEAFRNKIIAGKYPSCALYVQLPLDLVDVNVHPAKTEVKFAHDKKVFEAVYIACKNTLEQNDNMPLVRQDAFKPPAVREDHLTQAQQRIAAPQIKLLASGQSIAAAASKPTLFPAVRQLPIPPPVIDCDDDDDALVLSDAVSVQPPEAIGEYIRMKTEGMAMPVKTEAGSAAMCAASIQPLHTASAAVVPISRPIKRGSAAPPEQTPIAFTPEISFERGARVIGEAFNTYVVAEDAEGLILLDKHAAHERIIFNQLQKTTETTLQQLLTPAVAELTAEEFAVLHENHKLVASAGFDLEPFGKNSFAVRAVPAYLDAADVQSVLIEIADKLQSSRTPTSDRFDDLIHTVACKAAIKAGTGSSIHELQQLCDRVLSDHDIAACPHGRPVTVRLTKYEIDKLFKRVNQ